MKTGTDEDQNGPQVPLFSQFRTQLVLLILLVFIPALILTIHTNFRQRRTEMMRIRQSMSSLAREVAANEQNFVKNTRQVLTPVSQIPFLINSTERSVAQFHFDNLRRLMPDYLDFGLIETNGQLFCSSFPTNQAEDLSARSHVRQAIETGRFSIGHYDPGSPTIQPHLDFAFPILGSGGKLTRIMYASLDLEAMNKVAAEARLPAQTSITVFDAAGNVLAHFPNPAEWKGRSLKEEPFVQRILRDGEGVFETDEKDGQESLFAAATISDGKVPRLFVSVGVPKSVVFAEANRALWHSILILGIVATLALLVAHFYAKHAVLKPFQTLVSVARQLASGQMNGRTGMSKGQGELKELGRVFDEMADKLQQRQREVELAQAEIRQMNADLEKRVKERTAQLEEVNRELESFSYSVSHDLRAPLRHVDGFVGLLRSNAHDKLDANSHRYLDIIADAAKRMGKLIDDLLVFSRFGRSEMRRSQISLEELVEGVICDFKMAIGERNIIWKRGILPSVHGDIPMLRQVFVNLISNAIKYSQPRNPAIIEIGYFSENSEESVIFVRDNGVGFDMQYADKLFGVFERLHQSEQFEGTGIGLANVKRIVSRHGGRVWAESKENECTTFYFSLPKAAVSKSD